MKKTGSDLSAFVLVSQLFHGFCLVVAIEIRI